MTTPLIILFISSIAIGLLSTIFVVIIVSVDNWEYVSFNQETLQNINKSCSSQNSQPSCQVVQISADPILFQYDDYRNKKQNNDSNYIYSYQSGLWRTCDCLTDQLRYKYVKASSSNFDGQKCFTFVTDYNEDSDLLASTPGAKQIARLHNSAASCYIVVLIDLSSATVVGIIGLIQKQVASCMVTGVLYLMAALFGVFGLSMFHTKDFYEKYHCYGLEEIPSKLCEAKEVELGYAVPLAWLAVFTCTLSSLVWLCVSRALRVIRAKTML
ncbi:uncharacterized protein LOC131934000 [Physella acuta]|uniref:uncharacterized protein LOC131934000 n=1 Tax=Physella acuta TaxID=109671 RepID=UPI0027DD9491|nr:uncharacterized protein LOC131934000 [Physella acuta]XP_059146420.1 uncharacterized protein LOC131934000 [Physella acuta]XP_059146421.1 uncharacterized protein LOC131934000 [Physella acuta]XP_059146423.1 uncharacterized protein LOC131934000 [Physella acuta]